uniref:ribulose-phosphate 3-epimerase n=1 Tax=Marseillevirus LCMAC201 TaxID=2506605 RepID=A0A481YXN3_9VIRU|nr:MAG: ribulose-phosphate 3 epimerase family protein [Marseillevirus LCMAC201]
MVQIAPSILAADPTNLEAEIKAIEPYCEYIHIDIMDGHFVPNLSFGPAVVKSLREKTTRLLDVHLMIENPKFYVPIFADAGADIITVHVEVCSLKLFEKLALQLHDQHKKIGIALRPKTAITKILPYLKWTDLVLVMSVEPGFGGQEYIAATSDRVVALKKEIPCSIMLEVDGGITTTTAGSAQAAGADILVAGNAVFKSSDYRAAISALYQT